MIVSMWVRKTANVTKWENSNWDTCKNVLWEEGAQTVALSAECIVFWAFFSILEFGSHKLLKTYGFTLVTPILRGWKVFIRSGSSPTLGSFGPFHQRHHKSRVSLQGPPCAHGVADTPHEEERDNSCMMESFGKSTNWITDILVHQTFVPHLLSASPM